MSAVLVKYLALLDDLLSLNEKTEKKVMGKKPDAFITDNINFFTKSFTVLLCAYLESYIKDISMTVIDEVNDRLSLSKLPHNLILWSMNKKKEFKDGEMKFESLTVNITKKELDEHISGMPNRTENLFTKMGLNLYEDPAYRTLKEKITTIVVKRNKIVHHNDSASDLTFVDIKNNICSIIDYVKALDDFIGREALAVS